MDPNYSRPSSKAPPPGLNLPVSMGPIALPKPPPRKRRWGLMFVWTGVVFVGGGVVGFLAKDSVIKVGEQVGVNLGPKPSVVSPAPAVEPVSASPEAVAAAPKPAPAPVAAPSPAPAPAPQPVAKAEPAPEPVKAAPEPEKAAPEPTKAAHSTHFAAAEPAAEPSSGKHGKGSAKSAAAAGARKPGFDDPFNSDGDSAPAAKPAPAPAPKSETAKSAAPTAKSEPAKSASKSSALDDLMVDTPSDGKGKKRDNKDIDALLKDVQKPRTEPAPKKAEPAPAQSLSAADISRVMSVVKARSKECATKLGQKGVAELKITVAKSGSVSDVQLGGKLAGTPVGACIEKATRAASFPASSGLTFDYRVDAR